MARTSLFSRLTRLVQRSLADGTETTRAPLPPLSRRALLGASAALVSCGVRSESPPEPEPSTHPIAIVGGGLAGLSCAYFLFQAGVEVTVYEASDRVGGRVYTLRNELPGRLFCELGGEFIDSHHATMRLLARALGITLEANDFARESRSFWVGDRSVAEDELARALAEIAPVLVLALERAEESPGALLELDATPLSRWLEQNVPKSTFPELSALLEIAFRAEFGREIDQQSSVNLVHLLGAEEEAAVFGPNYGFRARDGNDLFARRLLEQVGQAVRTDNRMRALRRSGRTYSLSFENSRGIGFVDQAERVVLALPFSVLNLVDLSAAGLSAEKRGLIRDLKYGTHTKVVGVFNTAGAPSPRRILADTPFQVAWGSSPGQSTTQETLTNLLSGNAGLDASSTANAHMVAILPDLERAMSSTLNYVEGSARRVHWPSAPPFRGSVCSPGWGQWTRQVSAGRPEGDLHFCGEHTSVDFRGTMEGAAESGALVAAQILKDLARPLPASLEALLMMKSRVPQPCLRGADASLLGPLSRRRETLRNHSEFVAELP